MGSLRTLLSESKVTPRSQWDGLIESIRDAGFVISRYDLVGIDYHQVHFQHLYLRTEIYLTYTGNSQFTGTYTRNLGAKLTRRLRGEASEILSQVREYVRSYGQS